jgi:Ca-activated chloride channel family protein
MLFGAPALLKLLWIVPVLLALGIAGAWLRRRRLRRFAEAPLWSRLTPERSGALRLLRYVLALVAMAFAAVAAARPQVGARLVQVERRGIDVVVALDVSLSMEATDVVPNRLDRSKQEIRELLDGLKGNRVGIVLFSGSSFLLCPLTVDTGAANLFLDSVSPDVLPDPGTNLEEALRGARNAFGADLSDPRGRAVILFTDGESHVGDVDAAAGSLKEDGIPVLTVGVGTPNGQPIPIYDADGKLTGYKKDRSGEVVLSRLEEPLLRRVAESTGGRYYPATLQGHEVGDMLGYLDKLQKGELGGVVRRRVEERYQVPAAVAAVLLLFAIMVPEARRVEEGEPSEESEEPAPAGKGARR